MHKLPSSCCKDCSVIFLCPVDFVIWCNLTVPLFVAAVLLGGHNGAHLRGAGAEGSALTS